MASFPPRFRGTTPAIEAAARRHRSQLTPAEAKLWQALRRRQLAGLKFRCQHPVGRFILDFYCPEHRLVIEVDGVVHEHQREYDAARTAQLEEYGYRVLRFANAEVMDNLSVVLEQIREFVEGGGATGVDGATAEAPQPSSGEHC